MQLKPTLLLMIFISISIPAHALTEAELENTIKQYPQNLKAYQPAPTPTQPQKPFKLHIILDV